MIAHSPFLHTDDAQEIAIHLAPMLIRENNGFFAKRGLRSFSGHTAETFKHFLQGAVLDALTKPHEPPVVDVVVKSPQSTGRA